MAFTGWHLSYINSRQFITILRKLPGRKPFDLGILYGLHPPSAITPKIWWFIGLCALSRKRGLFVVRHPSVRSWCRWMPSILSFIDSSAQCRYAKLTDFCGWYCWLFRLGHSIPVRIFKEFNFMLTMLYLTLSLYSLSLATSSIWPIAIMYSLLFWSLQYHSFLWLRWVLDGLFFSC